MQVEENFQKPPSIWYILRHTHTQSGHFHDIFCVQHWCSLFLSYRHLASTGEVPNGRFDTGRTFKRFLSLGALDSPITLRTVVCKSNSWGTLSCLQYSMLAVNMFITMKALGSTLYSNAKFFHRGNATSPAAFLQRTMLSTLAGLLKYSALYCS